MTTDNFVGRRVSAERAPGGSRRITQIGVRLGGGSEGGIYRDQTRPDLVLKLLHAPELRVERKVRAMLAAAPELQVEQDADGAEIVQIAWPQELLFDSLGQFCGFSMRLLETNKTVPLNAWFDARARHRNQLSQSDLIRIYLAANLASVTEYVNRAGHSIVDFKPQNVLAYREHGYLCLVDCDGFLIRSWNDVFPAAMATPGYLAPEFHRDFDASKLDERQDRFALAVMIYTLLDNGFHPASGTSVHLPEGLNARLAAGAVFLDPASGLTPPGNSHYRYFTEETLGMFRSAFVGLPAQRPTSQQWKEHLRMLAYSMVQCSVQRDHWHYGKGCPWCALGAAAKVQIAAPAQTTSSLRSWGSASAQQPALSSFTTGSGSLTRLNLTSQTPPTQAHLSGATATAPALAPSYKLYDSLSVLLAALIGGPLIGAGIIALNFRRLGQKSKAIKALVIGLGIVVLISLIEAIVSIPSVATTGLMVGLAVASRSVAEQLQRGDLDQHIRHGGRRASRWAGLGLGIAGLVVILIVLFLGAMALEAGSKFLAGSGEDDLQRWLTMLSRKENTVIVIQETSTELADNPRNALARRARSSAYYLNKELAKGRKDAEEIESLLTEPESAAEFEARCVARFRLEKYAEAISDCTQAIAQDAQYKWAYQTRANAHANNNASDLALADYNKALALDPQFKWAYSNRGNTYALKNEHDRALADYDKVIELDPQEADAYTNRGDAYLNKSEYERAIADYNKALEFDSQAATTYNNRGWAFVNKGEYDRAITDFNKAIGLDPQFKLSYLNRGNVYHNNKKDYDRALSDFNKVIELDSQNAQAYHNRGAVYASKTKYDQAITNYSKAIELDPEYKLSYFNRGNAYHNKEDYDRAINDFNKVIELDPQNAKAYFNRGNAYALKKEYDRAITNYDKAVELDPRNATIYRNRGNAYYLKGEYDRAITNYDKLIELDPRNAAGYRNRADAYEAKGESALAAADRQKAQELQK